MTQYSENIKYSISLQKRTLIISLSATVLLLMIHPVSVLIAEIIEHQASRALSQNQYQDDNLDSRIYSINIIRPLLIAASIEKDALLIDPGKADRHNDFANLQHRIGKWIDLLSDMGQDAPNGMDTSREYYARALLYLKQAIDRVPSNPDYQLNLGRLFQDLDDRKSAEHAYRHALKLYPASAALHYAVAKEFVLMGKKKESLEIIADFIKIDDSYIVRQREGMQRYIRQYRTTAYRNFLQGSYLLKMMEVIWRASDRSVDVLDSMTPKNEDAQEVKRLFYEIKGIDAP